VNGIVVEVKRLRPRKGELKAQIERYSRADAVRGISGVTPRFKLADDSTENYTLAGVLISITIQPGLTTTLTYNAADQLTTLTGPSAISSPSFTEIANHQNPGRQPPRGPCRWSDGT
jgi:YD repeat-containing protein